MGIDDVNTRNEWDERSRGDPDKSTQKEQVNERRASKSYENNFKRWLQEKGMSGIPEKMGVAWPDK